jgi:protein-ribulosamine 3-kinase
MKTAIPGEVIHYLSTRENLTVKDFVPISGGCINSGGRLLTTRGNYFLKWNVATKFPGMFQVEALGLNTLRQTKAVCIPEVIATASLAEWQFILLEFIETKMPAPQYWHDLGHQLASLHRHSQKDFGLDHDNYIGSLLQVNHPENNWIEFFIKHRLSVQLDLAIKNGKIAHAVATQFQSLFKKLDEILPQEKPSLLHGDLWSGNLITNTKGSPCLIDPAIYFGNREAEIAFTRLFGGFSNVFYQSYHENFPLSPGFNDRSDVYNLYPLMVHVNLFGGGYANQVVTILKKYE